MTEPVTNLRRRALLMAAAGIALAAVGRVALRWSPRRHACGARLRTAGVAAEENSTGSALPAPQAMWGGYRDSSNVLVMCWPPPTGTPESYNVYRNGAKIASGILLDPHTGGAGLPQPWYVDKNLSPSTSYRYHMTAVSGGAESPPSPEITMTTLAATGTTLPAAPTDPSSYIQPYGLPVGGTTWTATNTSNNNAAGSGNNNSTGCGLQYALNHADIDGGDVIVASAGATYTAGAGGWQIPAFTGKKGWTYIISDQDPGYNRSGKLPAYSYATTPGGGNYVTPAQIPAMPTLQFTYGNSGVGMQIAAGCTKVRFVGLNVTPASGVKQQMAAAVSFRQSTYGNLQTPAESVYFDRCLLGPDSQDEATFGYVTHGLSSVNCNHLLVHQCHIRGFAVQGNGGDANGVFVQGGGPQCYQNSYFEAVAEGLLFGGAFVEQTTQPHDIVYRYNYNTKPTAWQSQKFGEGCKNHFELKSAVRVECYGNIHMNSWSAFAAAGQKGRSFVCRSADQTSNGQFPITRACPWTCVTDVNIHDNQIYNVNSAALFSTADVCATGHTATCRFANNLTFINPGTDDRGTKDNFWGIAMLGVPDFTIDHNTFIINANNPNAYGAYRASLFNTAFGQQQGSYGNPRPYSPNPLPSWCDRATVTNNILDGNNAVSGVGAGNGATAIQRIFNPANSTWSHNLTIVDGSSYPPKTHVGVAHGSIGFANWRGNTAAPAQASDWNVTSGAYSKASTTGGPLGATF